MRQYARASAVLVATAKRVDSVVMTGISQPRTEQTHELTVLEAIKGEKVRVVTHDFGQCGALYETNAPMVDGVRYLVFVSGLRAYAFHRLDGAKPGAAARAILARGKVSP